VAKQGRNWLPLTITERKNSMIQKQIKDHELFIFSHAMEILVKASTLKYQPFSKNHGFESIGVEGYGTISTLERLAGAMNVKGFRTSQGKYLTATNLKKMKSTLIKRYGQQFVADLVDWRDVSQFPLDDALMAKETKKEIRLMNAVDYKVKNNNQQTYYEWWSRRYFRDPETGRVMNKVLHDNLDKALGIAA
jgi:hypothetical protein